MAAASNYLEKRVTLFTCDNQCHLLGVQLQKAAQVPLKKLILHEIGHLLEPLLQDSAIEMEKTFYEGFPSAVQTLQEISPHYLGKNAVAALNQRRDSIDRPPFPQKRRKRSPQLIETISDLLNPS